MDELSVQARLAKSQVNILNMVPSGTLRYDGKSKPADSQTVTNTWMVLFEFPYRVNGERFWCKQVMEFKYTEDDIDAGWNVQRAVCEELLAFVRELRKELED